MWLNILWTDESQFKPVRSKRGRGPKDKWVPKIFRAQFHRCGSVMIEGHLSFSGLENKFKIGGIWGILPSCNTVGTSTKRKFHLILLLLGPKHISYVYVHWEQWKNSLYSLANKDDSDKVCAFCINWNKWIKACTIIVLQSLHKDCDALPIQVTTGDRWSKLHRP